MKNIFFLFSFSDFSRNNNIILTILCTYINCNTYHVNISSKMFFNQRQLITNTIKTYKKVYWIFKLYALVRVGFTTAM